jgi:hypothetical protein
MWTAEACCQEILELCGNFESSMTLPPSPVNKRGVAGKAPVDRRRIVGNLFATRQVSKVTFSGHLNVVNEKKERKVLES